MNDREAIKNAIETFRYYAPMASTVYNDCNASDEFYKAADDLEEILQELEERNKGCAWCKAEYTIIDDDFGRPNMIKFCWHCGRKLKEEHHAE